MVEVEKNRTKESVLFYKHDALSGSFSGPFVLVNTSPQTVVMSKQWLIDLWCRLRPREARTGLRMCLETCPWTCSDACWGHQLKLFFFFTHKSNWLLMSLNASFFHIQGALGF